jgi:hypothetical protein
MKTTHKLIALFTLLVITACSKLDVVGNDSVRAFNDLLQSAPVGEFAGLPPVAIRPEEHGWYIDAPDGSARFILGKTAKQLPPYNVNIAVMIQFDPAPFVAAGLNSDLLPEYFTVYKDSIVVEIWFESDQSHYQSITTPLSMYQHIVKLKRSSIGYHMQMDHYGINLGNGNMFEWAKNLSTNDKDIVFVLEPEPFIKAGVNPNNIEGWLYAQVTVDDENGKPIQVYKFLKPFNLL